MLLFIRKYAPSHSPQSGCSHFGPFLPLTHTGGTPQSLISRQMHSPSTQTGSWPSSHTGHLNIQRYHKPVKSIFYIYISYYILFFSENTAIISNNFTKPVSVWSENISFRCKFWLKMVEKTLYFLSHLHPLGPIFDGCPSSQVQSHGQEPSEEVVSFEPSGHVQLH